jgi:hypothetical protein
VIKKCKKCYIILNKDNTYFSDQKSGALICKNCRKINRKIQVSKNKQKQYSACKILNIKEKILYEYGQECICCGEKAWQFLSIDHIGNWGALHRKEIKNGGGSNFYRWLKKNNYPKDNFRTLCMNCNACIGFHGFCPHQIKKSNNCVDCNVLLDNKNQFKFHSINNVSICSFCILAKSIVRKTAQDKIDSKGRALKDRRKWSKNHLLNLRKKIIEGYGSKCVCCNESNYMFLTIDHINNDGYQEKRIFKNNMHAFYNYLVKKNFPSDKYRLLCYNCNCSRGFYGTCYHELCIKENKNNITIKEYKDILKRANYVN